MASPESPTVRFLWRSKLDGSGKPERVTPAGVRGSNTYNISPDGQYAFHTQARFDEPPMQELVKPPAHATVRVIDDAAEARKRGSARRRRWADARSLCHSISAAE